MALVAEANVIAVSLEYRLWPDRPLPGSYIDTWVGLQWMASHANGNGPEPRLNDHEDLSRFFMGGDCNGEQDPKLKPPAEDLANLGCKKVLIFLAEKDHLREMGWDLLRGPEKKWA
ncbi:unnamed protein product [Dovyalis caffra]|uniref:Alpha/beta hydrolase fold-3 domain-containing protein n=1 Tax=Dovyalis caffra TaxID=77055 RepID=A0AAV1RAN8_9ROSI|nr:unnamed protein product [Dovyalis caffra]